ncbi:MAG: metallopeptidase TldD-related protein [Spirochaetaceae bacterium]|nr:metallopeptidase TldD-related protein [Spirochaetaceae bacterium]
MMFAALRTAIAARGGIADWMITETIKNGSERYYIGTKTDMSRSVESRDYRLTLYVDDERDGSRFRGEASASIHPTMSAQELATAVDRAAFAASMSRNPWYELPEPRPALVTVPASRFEGTSPASGMNALAEALFSAKDGRSRINSLELFLSRIERRVINSCGVDAGWTVWSGYTEYTIESSGKNGAVELTDDFRFSDPDYERLTTEVTAALEAVTARADAEPTPTLFEAPLVLPRKHATETLGWFMINLTSPRIFARSSPLALEESVHGPEARPGGYDPLELIAEPAIRGSPLSAPFDGEGSPLGRAVCTERGVAKTIVGPSRYAQYLGIPALGDHRLFSVGPGSRSPESLRSGPHLEVVYFSDFVLDSDSGDFGGEIRLAWYSDGTSRRPVSGGSVSGAMMENRALLRYSNRIEANGSMNGPEAVLLPRVSVAGA